MRHFLHISPDPCGLIVALCEIVCEQVNGDELDRVLMTLSVEELQKVSGSMDDLIQSSSAGIVSHSRTAFIDTGGRIGGSTGIVGNVGMCSCTR